MLSEPDPAPGALEPMLAELSVTDGDLMDRGWHSTKLPAKLGALGLATLRLFVRGKRRAFWACRPGDL